MKKGIFVAIIITSLVICLIAGVLLGRYQVNNSSAQIYFVMNSSNDDIEAGVQCQQAIIEGNQVNEINNHPIDSSDCYGGFIQAESLENLKWKIVCSCNFKVSEIID